jgi:outer membrane protein assembly factor BamB
LADRYLRSLTILAKAGAVLLLGGCGGDDTAGTWALPNAGLTGSRAAADSAIDASSASRLTVRWRYPLQGRPGYAGLFASTPVVDAETVYLIDLNSNIVALERGDGRLRWIHRYAVANSGPNGVAVDERRVYAVTDTAAVALSKKTGQEVWHRRLTSATEQFVQTAPVPWRDFVFVSTVGFPPGGRGAVYGLDAATGSVRWRFDTIEKPWRFPMEAGGGGLWAPVSVDEDGRIYAGTANPAPWGGTPERPNGGAFPGPVRWTDSLIVLDARTGSLLWHDQVTPHDIRDYDFQATPVLADMDGRRVVFGAGKAGRVIAWDRDTQQRIWERTVGLHQNDTGPLPVPRVTVCPGLLGGVETSMAYAAGRLFVPVVDLCGWGSAVGSQDLTTLDASSGTGRLVALDAATGRSLWERRLPSPVFGCATVSNDVVLTATFDGVVHAFAAEDGSAVWQARMRAGVNACPAVAGDLLLLGAGVRQSADRTPEVAAFALP